MSSRHLAQRLLSLAATINFDRPRDAMGQYAPGEDGASPADMAAAYGDPSQRTAPAVYVSGGIGALAGLGGAAGARSTGTRLAKLRKK